MLNMDLELIKNNSQFNKKINSGRTRNPATSKIELFIAIANGWDMLAPS